jgi:hypothetical protein
MDRKHAADLLDAAAREAQSCVGDMRYRNSELCLLPREAEFAYQTEMAAQQILESAIEAGKDLAVKEIPDGLRAAQIAYWLARGLRDAFFDGEAVDGRAIAPVLEAATAALLHFAYLAKEDQAARHYGWGIDAPIAKETT